MTRRMSSPPVSPAGSARPLRLRRVAAALSLALLFGAPLGAQTWSAVGPPGGDVRSLASDPLDRRRIYLGTADGVLYRSDDAGLVWQRTSPGFPLRGRCLDSIAVDPYGSVWVGYWEISGTGGGVAVSQDQGRTFTRLPGIEGQSVRALAVVPSDPNAVVAGTLSGVFLTKDRGSSWQRVSPEQHPDLRNVESLAVDPARPGVIYAGTWHLAWRTLDGGASWHPLREGMIDDSDVFTMTVDQQDPLTVYATACTGIYRSRDGGLRWSRVQVLPSSSRRTRAFAQDPELPNRLYAGTTEGVWVSEDRGATWRLATRKTLVVNAVLVSPGGTVLVGADGAGVLRSADGGTSWTASNEGFSERFVSRIAFDTVARRILVALWGDRSAGGVLAAPSSAGPWTPLAGGLEGRQVLSLSVTDGDVLAGTDEGVFLNSSTTGRWIRLPALLPGGEAHPRVNDVLALSDRVWLAATGSGLLRTIDRGDSWHQPSHALSGEVTALTQSSRETGLVAAASNGRVFLSSNQGETWGIAGVLGATTHGLSFLPGDDRVLFAATRAGLHKSRDYGLTWAPCGSGLPQSDITGLALHPDGKTLYASDYTWGGIFKSEDSGESWKRIPAEGLVTERAWALGLDPSAPDRLLAASRAGGLHLLSYVAPPAVSTTPRRP